MSRADRMLALAFPAAAVVGIGFCLWRGKGNLTPIPLYRTLDSRTLLRRPLYSSPRSVRIAVPTFFIIFYEQHLRLYFHSRNFFLLLSKCTNNL